MSVNCTLKSCRKAIDQQTGKVEVRAFKVSPKDCERLQVNWNIDGEAVFHPGCWTNLKKAVRGDSDDIDLSDLEVKLITEADKTAEYHDPESFIKAEADRIVKMIKNCEYCIAFTGAGISTAAGIGDFRGKDGKWTENDKRKEHGNIVRISNSLDPDEMSLNAASHMDPDCLQKLYNDCARSVQKVGIHSGQKGTKTKASRGYSISELRPTYTHEALAKLLELDLLKYVISQNTDGIHRLSGVPPSKISELHGNAFVQKCEKCQTRYDFPRGHRSYVGQTSVPAKPCERCRINHRTGQVCNKKGCGGYLMNTIINFGDYLEGPVLSSAEDNAKMADMVLCLGSTLRVSPANSLVEMGKQPIRLVICNRQGTPYDNICVRKDSTGTPHGSRIHGDCDKLMKEVLRGILGNGSLKEWEDGREARMAVYNDRRN